MAHEVPVEEEEQPAALIVVYAVSTLKSEFHLCWSFGTHTDRLFLG